MITIESPAGPRAATLETAFLAEAMQEAAYEVFSTMLNQTATQAAPIIRQSIEVLNDGVVSLIGITGEWVGSGVLSCSSPCARWMSSQMMMAEFDEVDDEVLDAIGEITNMIIGNFKNTVAEQTGPLAMSVPAVVHGQNMHTTTRGGSKEWIAFPITCQEHYLELLVQLRPRSATRRG
jgi:chemotaxis protein CheX